MSSSTGNADASSRYRNNERLDRLVDQVGEHQLTITQQGVSVNDVSERLRALESTLHKELQCLWTLKDLDVPRELSALRSTTDKLQKQLIEATRQHDETHLQHQAQLQHLEERQSATEARLNQLTDQVEEAMEQQAATLTEMHQSMKAMVAEVVTRIADQFDAVQSDLDATTQRQSDHTQVSEMLHQELVQQGKELASLREAQVAAEEREGEASILLQDALTLWQHGLEEQLGGLSTKFDEYKAYIKRLRKEVHELQEERAAYGAQMGVLQQELGGTQQGMRALHREAAAILGELQEVNSEAIGMEDALMR